VGVDVLIDASSSPMRTSAATGAMKAGLPSRMQISL
jgi:hypothetical protein